MSKLAIDVVLLPPPEISQQAVVISRKLAETSRNHKIILDGQQYLPHISLCMGVVREEDLPAVNAVLADIVKQPAIPLTIRGIKAHTISASERLAVLEFDNQPQLQTLHETIVQRLRPFLSYDDVDDSMFVAPPAIEPISHKWLRDFDPAKGAMRYYPHLTSGFGDYDQFTFPLKFTASTLAVCQLGNYCTCRKVLSSFKLQ